MRPLIVCFCFLICIEFASAQRSIEKEFKTVQGQLMDIDLRSTGSIIIRGWDKELARVKVDFGQDEDVDNFKFTFDTSSSGISIISELIHPIRERNIDLDVFVNVPRKYHLNLRTLGGSVEIYDMESNINGHTAGGDITLRDSKLDGEVHSMGGTVLIENVIGDIRGHSAGGEVIYRNVVTPERAYPKDQVYIRKSGGSVKVNDAPAGADVFTSGGDIHIHSAQEFVRAETAAGDIFIDRLDGWVDATTFKGNISLKLIGNPLTERDRDVTLECWQGDVIILIPPDFPMDIDVIVGNTEESIGNYRIVSDFDLVIEKDDKWTTDRILSENISVSNYEAKLHVLHGKGIIKGGDHKITIKAVNGNVYIKKVR